LVLLQNKNHSELLDLIANTIPEDREINTFVKNKIIIGFANNYFPELQVLANDIKSDMGNLLS
jgi:transcriptional regulator of nitric oxide reductase